MLRNSFRCLIGFVALLGSAADRPPNFVVLLVDDLGWADIGVYGSDLHQTPNIDRLASESLRFTNAYAASPVCTPTRASIMTGKYPARLHMTVWHEASANPPQNRKLVPPVTRGSLPHEEVTIAEVLHQAGYFTAHVGKWHLGTAGYYPETQGFDLNIGGTFWGAPQSFFYPYRGSQFFDKNPRYVPGLHWGEHGEYLTDRLTEEALRVIDRAGDGPFFLNMCYHTVHTPIEAKPEVVDRYREGAKKAKHHRNPTYAAMVQSLDESVGRILAKLPDNTIVIFTSDNGGYVNRWQDVQVTDNHPLRSGKGSLYEGGVRVPLLIRWPGVSRDGSVSDEPVSTIDFFPTMVEMAGLTHAPVDGLSLAALVKDPSARLDRDALYFHYPHYYPTTTPVSSIRERDWKLLHYYEDDKVELYNLANDGSESRDLSASQSERVRKLRRKLDAWREEVKAQEPEANPKVR